MPDYGIDVVSRAVQVLDALADSDNVGLPQLSRELGISRASAFRLLRTLAAHDMVVQHPETKRYKLGPRLIALGHRAAEANDVLEAATTELEDLVARFQVVVTVNLPTHDAVIEARRLPRAVAREFIPLGAPIPFHACASGIVFLAADSQLRSRIEASPLVRFASNTPVDSDGLAERIAEVRRLGYAFARDTLEEGVTALAAPIVDARGAAIATLGVAAPSGAFHDAEWSQLGRELTGAAARVGRSIGGPGVFPRA